MSTETYPYELSIVMPCLNEAETIAGCIEACHSFISKNRLNAEIIVADNGSTDGSQKIAESLDAKVVNVNQRGYGSALIGGITAARGKFIIMGDSDGSHDLGNLEPFLEKLRDGYDLVVGNRFSGGIKKGAMSFLNRYIGNPFLSGIGRLFFPGKVRDFHCGLRGFTRKAFDKMELRTTGMEFASEMIVKATLLGIKMVEVPTKMLPSGRSRPPHLRAFRDGWRHLRFLLIYSPRWLFLIPGMLMILIGFGIGVWLLPGSKYSLDIHTMLYGSLLAILGFQAVSFALITKTYAVQERLMPENSNLRRFLNFITLERGLIVGIIMIITGLTGSIYAVLLLEGGEFRQLGIPVTMRIVIPSITLLALGFQIVFTSFFIHILRLKLK